MEDILEGLNEKQREAVTSTEGYIRVIAGAGSGKTRALSRRFAYLVDTLGILPGHILCVTFTNKAAAEMRQRIHYLTGDNDTGYIATFHSFCVSVLKEDSHAVSYPKNFLVLDNSDIDAMLQTIYDERKLTLRDMTFSKARDMIEMKKCVHVPDYYKDMIAMSIDELRQKYLAASDAADIIFYGYLYQEKKCFGLDYNDLIKVTLHIFEEHEDIRLKWQKRLEYIMIDEFQDIDPLQYDLMKVLCGYHKNLFIVGDPDQTIYTWRGASVRYLMNFDENFPGTKTIMMMDNYRSTPEILRAVNSLIDKNQARMKKSLIPHKGSGMPVVCHFSKTSKEEAEWIADEIMLLLKEGAKLSDMAILYRAHYVTRTLEEALLKKKIPYTIYSGTQFFDRMEVKDALSYLRMLIYKDDLSFARIANRPRRNLGKRRMAFLKGYAERKRISLYDALKDTMDEPLFKGTGAARFVGLIERFSKSAGRMAVSEVLAAILDESGYEEMLRTEGSQERLDNLAEFRQAIYEYEAASGEENNLEQFLSQAALFSNIDRGAAKDKVKLMTIHTAKGLEFPYVFLAALNEGIFPSKKTRTLQGMEEERRLAFVAMTRAESRLYLTEGGGRNLDGSARYPSRFIFDIDPDALSINVPLKESLLKETKHYISAQNKNLRDESKGPLLKKGTRIRHPVFGYGIIAAASEENKSYIISFDSMDTPREISFKAKLYTL